MFFCKNIQRAYRSYKCPVRVSMPSFIPLHKNRYILRYAEHTCLSNPSIALRSRLRAGWPPDIPRNPVHTRYFYSVFSVPAPVEAAASPCPLSVGMSSICAFPPLRATFLRMTMIHTADTTATTAPTTMDTGIPNTGSRSWSVRRLSTQNLPTPYPKRYRRNTAPSNFLRRIYQIKSSSNARFHRDSYKKVGCTCM